MTRSVTSPIPGRLRRPGPGAAASRARVGRVGVVDRGRRPPEGPHLVGRLPAPLEQEGDPPQGGRRGEGRLGHADANEVTIRPRRLNDPRWCLPELEPSGRKEPRSVVGRFRLGDGEPTVCPSVSVSSSAARAPSRAANGARGGTRQMKVPGVRMPTWKRPAGAARLATSRRDHRPGRRAAGHHERCRHRPRERLVGPHPGRRDRGRGRRRRHDPRRGRDRGQGDHRAEAAPGRVRGRRRQALAGHPGRARARRRGRAGGRPGHRRAGAVVVQGLLVPADQQAGGPQRQRRPGRGQRQGDPVRARPRPQAGRRPHQRLDQAGRRQASSSRRPRTAASSTSRRAPAPWPRACAATPATSSWSPGRSTPR